MGPVLSRGRRRRNRNRQVIDEELAVIRAAEQQANVAENEIIENVRTTAAREWNRDTGLSLAEFVNLNVDATRRDVAAIRAQEEQRARTEQIRLRDRLRQAREESAREVDVARLTAAIPISGNPLPYTEELWEDGDVERVYSNVPPFAGSGIIVEPRTPSNSNSPYIAVDAVPDTLFGRMRLPVTLNYDARFGGTRVAPVLIRPTRRLQEQDRERRALLQSRQTDQQNRVQRKYLDDLITQSMPPLRRDNFFPSENSSLSSLAGVSQLGSSSSLSSLSSLNS